MGTTFSSTIIAKSSQTVYTCSMLPHGWGNFEQEGEFSVFRPVDNRWRLCITRNWLLVPCFISIANIGSHFTLFIVLSWVILITIKWNIIRYLLGGGNQEDTSMQYKCSENKNHLVKTISLIQKNLYNVGTQVTGRKCPFYRGARFMEIMAATSGCHLESKWTCPCIYIWYMCSVMLCSLYLLYGEDYLYKFGDLYDK